MIRRVNSMDGSPTPPRARSSKLATQVDTVLRATRALVGIAAASIATVDDEVSLPQLRVLVMIDTRGPLNLAAVAETLQVNPSNASRACDQLVQAGLLERRDSAADRRNVELTLSAAGQALVDRITVYRRRSVEAALRKLSSTEREHLVSNLDLFATAAGEPEDGELLTAIWPRRP